MGYQIVTWPMTSRDSKSAMRKYSRYPCDSLASCFNSPAPRAVTEFTKCWCKWDCSGADVALKMLCLHPRQPPPSAVQMLQRGMWQPRSKPEMSMTLRRMMMMTMSDSGSTIHIITVLWQVEQFEIIPYLCCQTACWRYCGFINMKENVEIFTRDSIYAIARICYRPSVCPSVRHTGGSYKNGWS